MDSDDEYEEDSGEEDSYDYTGEESNPEEVTEERCRFDWQDEELDNKDRGEHPTTPSTTGTIWEKNLENFSKNRSNFSRGYISIFIVDFFF